MHNRYLLMRHAHSLANQAGLIVSDPAKGVEGYGLSAQGYHQLESVLADWHWPTPTLAVHSDFLRTAQTARRVGEHFGIACRVDTGLRERYFGAWDGGSDRHYAAVWARDAVAPGEMAASHVGKQGVETVAQVAGRMRGVLASLDARLNGEVVLVVSHGDPLQILLTALAGRPLSAHRDQRLLEPASVTLLE